MPYAGNGIAGVILAAGGGTRLGGGKLLLPWRGKPILAHVAETAARCKGLTALLLVLGHGAPDLRNALGAWIDESPLPVGVIENPDWEAGQSTSLRCGLEAAVRLRDNREPSGIMVLLGDQPAILAETLDLLVAAHGEALARNPDHPATAPLYRGERGNPVILSQRLFPAVRELTGDIGARHILRSLGSDLLLVPVEDSGVLRDVDTQEAYRRLSHDA